MGSMHTSATLMQCNKGLVMIGLYVRAERKSWVRSLMWRAIYRLEKACAFLCVTSLGQGISLVNEISQRMLRLEGCGEKAYGDRGDVGWWRIKGRDILLGSATPSFPQIFATVFWNPVHQTLIQNPAETCVQDRGSRVRDRHAHVL